MGAAATKAVFPQAGPWPGAVLLATAAVVSLGCGAFLLLRLHGMLAVHDPKIAAALVAGLMAAAATALGTLPVVFSQRLSQRVNDTLLGFGAGVMLAATAFSLVAPALRVARSQGAGGWEAGAMVGAAVLLGAGLLMAAGRVFADEPGSGGSGEALSGMVRRAWLFVLAIVLHNMPEGLAIGVAFGGPDSVGAFALAGGIAIQDVPEGLVVALALRSVGYGRLLAVVLGAASGLVEPVFAVGGAALMSISVKLLPWGLAGAAGAMLFVISHEIIPQSHRGGNELLATAGLMGGFVLMTILDTALN